MPSARTKKYITQKRKTSPFKNSEEVRNQPDNKIDQDFPGFPVGHLKENIIKLETSADKKTADINNKAGEKRDNPNAADNENSDGSANAFSAAEEVRE